MMANVSFFCPLIIYMIMLAGINIICPRIFKLQTCCLVKPFSGQDLNNLQILRHSHLVAALRMT